MDMEVVQVVVLNMEKHSTIHKIVYFLRRTMIVMLAFTVCFFPPALFHETQVYTVVCGALLGT